MMPTENVCMKEYKRIIFICSMVQPCSFVELHACIDSITRQSIDYVCLLQIKTLPGTFNYIIYTLLVYQVLLYAMLYPTRYTSTTCGKRGQFCGRQGVWKRAR